MEASNQEWRPGGNEKPKDKIRTIQQPNKEGNAVILIRIENKRN